MRFRVLGPLTVGDTVVPASRERTVLALLLLEPNRVVPVERLVDAVWGDSPPVTARAQIHTCVSRLRRSVPEVATDPAGYRLVVPDDGVDSLVFAGRVAGARDATARGQLTEAHRSYRSALDLWRGSTDSAAVRRGACASRHRVCVLRHRPGQRARTLAAGARIVRGDGDARTVRGDRAAQVNDPRRGAGRRRGRGSDRARPDRLWHRRWTRAG